MSLYVVLVDKDIKGVPGAEPVPPKAVAHNLTREAAEQMEARLASDRVEGHPTGWAVYLWEDSEPHAETEPEHCLQCQEVALEHCKYLLRLLEQERTKRPLE